MRLLAFVRIAIGLLLILPACTAIPVPARCRLKPPSTHETLPKVDDLREGSMIFEVAPLAPD
jgi:hypothetical protein